MILQNNKRLKQILLCINKDNTPKATQMFKYLSNHVSKETLLNLVLEICSDNKLSVKPLKELTKENISRLLEINDENNYDRLFKYTTNCLGRLELRFIKDGVEQNPTKFVSALNQLLAIREGGWEEKQEKPAKCMH